MSSEVDAIWARHGHVVTERVLAIRAVVADPSDERVAAAYMAAHKLAGALGTLGEPRAGDVAARLEAVLESPPVDVDAVAALERELVAALPAAVRPA